MINNSVDFNLEFKNTFGNINTTTLSQLKRNRVRFNLGGELSGESRIAQAMDRSIKLLDYCFKNKLIWLRIILWTKSEEQNLLAAGVDLTCFKKRFKETDIDDVLYLEFKYSYPVIRPIITSIINFDLAEKPSANITCYMIDFDSCLIANIYDDRGMDVYSTKKALIKDIEGIFHAWINQ